MTLSNGAVRYATLADLTAVLALDRLAPVGHARVELLTARVHSGEVLVFALDDSLVAFASFRSRGFIGRDFIELLSVATDQRRRGIASALLEEAVRRSSTDRIFTSTNESNVPMLALLAKHHWRFSGRLEGIDDGDPEMIFYRDAPST